MKSKSIWKSKEYIKKQMKIFYQWEDVAYLNKQIKQESKYVFIVIATRLVIFHQDF